jgi:hypothetical protein
VSAEPKSAPEVAAELQRLYDASLPGLLDLAKALVETIPPKRLPFMQYVYFSIAERIFILIQDVHESFMTSLETGYFTSAALTRSIMESATILALLNRDNTGEVYSAFLEHQEKEATKRRDKLADMTPKHPYITWAAKNESEIASRVLNALTQARAAAALPAAKENFPNMSERCLKLGENWEFVYHAIYRDLCEAVHGAFLKVPYSPAHAFSSPNQGAALIHEHCRTMSWALEFWAFAMMECFTGHPDVTKLNDFRDKLTAFIDADARLINSFSASARVIKIVF